VTNLNPTAAGIGRPQGRARFKLHGLTWLVWRQHRTSFRLWIVLALALTGYLIYLHAAFASYLTTQAAGTDPGSLPPDVGFSVAAFLLYITPLLAGTAFGAQTFEHEYTVGTFVLACTQSVSPTAWVRAKLLVPTAMIVFCVTPCAAALTWDYDLDPNRQQIFLGREIFEAIGPAAVALAIVGFLIGAAAGITFRSSGAAPALSLLLALAFKLSLWALPNLLEQQPHTPIWSVQWTATGICTISCAGLAAYCLRLIRRRPC
jgi:hypothetical protein